MQRGLKTFTILETFPTLNLSRSDRESIREGWAKTLSANVRIAKAASA